MSTESSGLRFLPCLTVELVPECGWPDNPLTDLLEFESGKIHAVLSVSRDGKTLRFEARYGTGWGDDYCNVHMVINDQGEGVGVARVSAFAHDRSDSKSWLLPSLEDGMEEAPDES